MPGNSRTVRRDLRYIVLALVAGVVGALAVLVSPPAVTAANASTVGGSIGRSEVIARARDWYDQNLPYSQSTRHYGPFHNHTYREDCSGFVSMAWHVNPGTYGGYNTDSIPSVAPEIKFANLMPGDVLNSPQSKMGHVVLFEKWVSAPGGDFWMYEENGYYNTIVHRKWSSSSYASQSINKNGTATSGTWTPRRYQNIVSDGTNTNPNTATPSALCGSGYYWLNTHSLGGATVYLLWNNSTSKNCVVTLQHNVDGGNSMDAWLYVQASGAHVSDPGTYSSYAGPVRAYAPSCINWGGKWSSTSWSSGWSHC